MNITHLALQGPAYSYQISLYIHIYLQIVCALHILSLPYLCYIIVPQHYLIIKRIGTLDTVGSQERFCLEAQMFLIKELVSLLKNLAAVYCIEDISMCSSLF